MKEWIAVVTRDGKKEFVCDEDGIKKFRTLGLAVRYCDKHHPGAEVEYYRRIM